VTAAVIQRNGKLLIAQRPAEGMLGGLWEFPGGKLEPGETVDQALHRELAEEFGLRVRVDPQVLDKPSTEMEFKMEASDRPSLQASSDSRFMKPL
jgi:A/G-specific adenine glycosylase